MIKRVCAQCGIILGYKPGGGVHGISHGYCDACRANFMGRRQIESDHAFQVRMEMSRQASDLRAYIKHEQQEE